MRIGAQCADHLRQLRRRAPVLALAQEMARLGEVEIGTQLTLADAQRTSGAWQGELEAGLLQHRQVAHALALEHVAQRVIGVPEARGGILRPHLEAHPQRQHSPQQPVHWRSIMAHRREMARTGHGCKWEHSRARRY